METLDVKPDKRTGRKSTGDIEGRTETGTQQDIERSSKPGDSGNTNETVSKSGFSTIAKSLPELTQNIHKRFGKDNLELVRIPSSMQVIVTKSGDVWKAEN